MRQPYGHQLEDDIRSAVQDGDIERLKQVLDIENGPPRRPDDGGCLFALFIAAYRGNADIVRLLIDKGVAFDAKAPETKWPALDAAAGQGHASIVRLLLDHGAKADVRITGTDATPLIGAAGKGRNDIVKMMLEAGADVNARQTNGWTALTLAARNDNTETVKILLEAGADRKLRNCDGRNALDYASQQYDNSDPSYPDVCRNPRTAELLRNYFPPPRKRTSPEAKPPAPRLIVRRPQNKLKLLPRRNGPPAP